MISVAAAKQIIAENIPPAKIRRVPLIEAAGLVLVADVFAALDIPAYPQSSMDGYAFSFDDLRLNQTLHINGEVAAGAGEIIQFKPRQAVRIFTGAAVPPGADTVVMQEKVRVSDGELLIEDDKIFQGNNVRPKGSEIKNGELALAKETILTPAALGFLAGIGTTHVDVYTKPAISIIVTGKELQQPGNELKYGQVYESNSATITAALHQLFISGIKLFGADDDLGMLTGVLNMALDQSDIVLLTGGVSVGDYDFVLEAAKQCGIQQLFHKIKQRPGKPLFFGRKTDQLVFGLPGNPSSVLTCFYEYVAPALAQFSKRPLSVRVTQVPLQSDYQKPAGLTHFLKGWFDGQTAKPLSAQESYRLSSFARANCLIQLDEERTVYKTGELVEVHLLPV